MQPYQEAGETIRRQAENPVNAIKSLAGIGLGGIGISAASQAGAALMKRAMPLLSKYVPQELAIKGLNKLDPRFGKFIKKAMDEGYDYEEVKDFMEKKGEKELSEEQPKEGRNIIEQYSPELFQFLNEQLGRGLDPIQAGAIAQNDKRFGPIIQKMMKDHKTPWSNIVEGIFGKEMRRQSGLSKFNERLKKPGVREQEMERFQQGYGQQPEQQQPQVDQGISPQIALLLQQGQQIINKYRGQNG